MGKKRLFIWAIFVLTACMAINSFAEEVQKGTKIKVIKEKGNSKEIQFLDESGKVKKKISLESKWDTVTKTVDISGTKKTYKLKRLAYKRARTSANGKFAAISTNVEDRSYTDESGNEQYIDGGYVSGKIALMDESGNTIWEKQLPDKKQVEESFIADNGETVAVEGALLMGGETGDPSNIFVFDKSGNEILRFIGLRIERLSPNGKYLAATVAHGQSLITRFYNLTNKKYWDADKEYVVYKISEDGLVRAGDRNVSGKSVDIDLKSYIGD